MDLGWKLPHRHTHRLAPEADLLVVHSVDGAVGPLCWGGWEWGAVGVAGGGVDGEEDKAFAVAAIHLQLALVEKCSFAAPAPIDIDAVAAHAGFDVGLNGGEVGRGFLGAFDAEGLADGDVVVGVRLDRLHQGAKADFDPRRGGGDAGWKGGRHGRSGGWRGAAVAGDGLPGGPLLGAIAHKALTREDVGEIIGVRRLAGHHGWGYSQGGGVGGNVGLKGEQLGRKCLVVGGDVVGFGHEERVLELVCGCLGGVGGCFTAVERFFGAVK